jgi:hypothetical protein
MSIKKITILTTKKARRAQGRNNFLGSQRPNSPEKDSKPRIQGKHTRI